MAEDKSGPGAYTQDNKNQESIADIPQNKTLVVEQLTDEAPLGPDIVGDLKNVKDVFNYFQPGKDVEFETEDGSAASERLEFRGLEDFGKKGITKQSMLLNDLNLQFEDLQKFVMRMKQNKNFKTVLETPELKEAYLSIVKNLIAKLEANGD